MEGFYVLSTSTAGQSPIMVTFVDKQIMFVSQHLRAIGINGVLVLKGIDWGDYLNGLHLDAELLEACNLPDASSVLAQALLDFLESTRLRLLANNVAGTSSAL